MPRRCGSRIPETQRVGENSYVEPQHVKFLTIFSITRPKFILL